MGTYDPKKIEKKWQNYWESENLFATPADVTAENKMYVLPQLPYPSGSGLHVGHAETYIACDIFARFQRMKGKKVLQVFGLDSFGLPAENYAIKTNVHPKKTIDQTGEMFVSQVKSLGISVDWDRFVRSSDPSYYKWTQWFFLLMYERGLAYRKKQSVNWCNSCKTVLANEQVVNGNCERCDSEVKQRDMEQWFLKITDYADRLEKDLDKVDWPEETKRRQRNWIGRSGGAVVKFKISDLEVQIDCFTTRPDTLFGATYLVVAPEHKLLIELKDSIENWSKVEKYIEKTKKLTELQRQTSTEKTGVELQGIKAINPATKKEIPVWIGDYVLGSYGTGAIMAVPAHDERDFEFANKFKLPIVKVVSGGEAGACSTEPGMVENSDFIDGMSTDEAKVKMIEWLEKENHGEKKVTYRLRDWSVSRQRFWGAPLPMLRKEQDAKSINRIDFVLNLHAWGSDPTNHYHPWLDEQLDKISIKSVTPELPNKDIPNSEEWLEVAQSSIGSAKNLVVTGRSLGCWTALKLGEKNKIKKIVLAAPVSAQKAWFENVEDKLDISVAKSFVGGLDGDIDFELINENVDEVVVYLSDTDPYIPMEETKKYFKEKIKNCRIVTMRDSGHFDSENGYSTFPQLFGEVVKEPYLNLHALKISDLPVILPDDVDFKPTGESPLNYSKDFQKGIEEKYGKGWRREVDTLDTFMCSSWYFFRYLDPKNDGVFASPESLKKWMPVDFYLGGEEHVNGHLLYSRFFTKVLFDAGLIDFDEPFAKTRHQGTILGPDNRKMSKRWGNVVSPTDVIEEFGADTCRTYEMFMGPLEDTKPWSTNGVRGVRRFLDRVYGLQDKVSENVKGESGKGIDSLVHKTLKKVGDDFALLKFNTAIAKLMELSNEMQKLDSISKEHFGIFTLMLAPLAPHLAEHMWRELGNKESLAHEAWPKYDETKLIEDVVTMVVQVNGKVRANIEVSPDILEDEAKEKALEEENVVKWLEGRELKKIVFIKGKIISIVV